MAFFFSFLGELIFLFFLSQMVTKRLSFSLFQVTRNKKFTVYFLAFLFFPGTVIHELAHFFTAILLFVRTGEMNLFPKLQAPIKSGQGSHIRLGSVQVAKSDPIRRFFIGVAPIIVGTTLLLTSLFSFQTFPIQNAYIKMAIEGYILFEVGNTMFSSKKDVEGSLELLGVLVILGILAYVFGLRIPIDRIFTTQTIAFFKTCSQLLLIPLGIDLGIIAVFKLLSKS